MKAGTHDLSSTLYSKTIDGNIKYWKVKILNNFDVQIEYGSLYGKPITNIITCTTSSKAETEALKRFKEKYNKGYRSIKNLNIKSELELDTALQEVVLDKNESFKPMLCQPFKLNKDKWPRWAQPKINGLRGTNSFEEREHGKGMFKTTTLDSVFRSREGLEYALPLLSKAMLEQINEVNYRLLNYDGELYIPDAPLNVIKSAVPYINEFGTVSKSNENTNKIQYWIFDLAIPIYTQHERLDKLTKVCKLNTTSVIRLSNNPHRAMEVARAYINLSDNIFIVGGMMIHNDDQAIWYRDGCITAGFEGCVFRDLDAEYAFGQRPQTITKFKKFKTTECLIIDVIDEGDNNNGESIKFVLKNDINKETFKCSISASFDIRKNLLANKYEWIGKYATIEYGERSGVKKCPFHSNVIAWDRASSGDLDITKLNKE